jgi:hypothetical protein
MRFGRLSVRGVPIGPAVVRKGVAVAAFLLAGLAAPGLARAQVVTENAGTLSPETPIWQTRFEILKTKHVTDLRAAETFQWAPNGVMDFALTVPVHHRDVEFAGGLEDTLEGVGDASLRAKLSVWKEDEVMASTRFSAQAGVKVPTGRWHEEDSGLDIPRKLQLGTGGWDVYGGPLFTAIADRHRFAAELVGRYAFERDEFRLQPSLQIGLAYWYRVAPVRIEVAGEETEVRGVVEVTTQIYGQSEQDGRGIGDDGIITWLSPGLQVYPSLDVLFEASVQIPVIETVEDVRGDRKFGALVSVKFLF